MKKKRIALVAISIVVFLLAVNFFVNGFEFSIYGVCSFNSKYYDSPKIAFEQNETMDISEDIGIAEIDSHNVMYLAKAEDGNILAAQMKCKNDGYFFVGDYSLSSDYSFESLLPNEYPFSKNCMYKENGLFKCNFEYFITKELVVPNIEGCTVKSFDIGTDENLYFVYKIIDE